MVCDALSDKADNGIKKFNEAFDNLWKCLSDRMSVDQIQQAHQLIVVTEGIKAVGVYFVVFSLYVVLILSVKWRISSSMTSLVPSFHLCNMMVIGLACQALGCS